MKKLENRLSEYVNFLEMKYRIYYEYYLETIEHGLPITAEYWNGVKEATIATIKDLKDILGDAREVL